MKPRFLNFVRIATSVLVIALAGCTGSSPSNSAGPATRGPLPTLANIPWKPYAGSITVANVSAMQHIGNLLGHKATVNHIQFARGGRWMVTTDADNTALVWDTTFGVLRHRIGGNVLFAAFAPDDTTLIAAITDGTIRFIAVESGQQLASAPGGPFTWAEISPDNAIFAGGTSQGALVLWDTRARSPLRTVAAGSGIVTHIAFSPDGSKVAAIVNNPPQSGGLLVGVWNVADGTPVIALRGFGERPPGKLAYSPDGKNLAVIARTEVRMYDTANYSQRYSLVGDDLFADRSVAFSPDSALFAATGRTENVYVWAVADGKQLAGLPKHGGGASSVSFSPSGELFLTTNILPGAGASVWQPQTFTPGTQEYPRGSIAAGVNGILTAAWSPDGQLLVLAEGSGGLMIWGIPKT